MNTTNIDELLNHIRKLNKGIFTNSEFTKHAQKAGDIMQSEVQNAMKNVSGMDYHQSYQLKRTIGSQTADFKVTNSRAIIGFGQIDDLNQQTKRRAQRGTFISASGETRIVKLRPERDLPSWVIMEFGRKGTAQSGAKVPSFISKEIHYSPRPSKKFMVGPSESLHFRAPIFFMTANTQSQDKDKSRATMKLREHSGIREGKMFRTGLKNAIPKIQEELAKGIMESLKSNIKQHGGKGAVTRL